jgi:hypothetical protein
MLDSQKVEGQGIVGVSPWLSAKNSTGSRGEPGRDQNTPVPHGADMQWSEDVVRWFFFWADIPIQPEQLQIMLAALEAPDAAPAEARRARVLSIRRIQPHLQALAARGLPAERIVEVLGIGPADALDLLAKMLPGARARIGRQTRQLRSYLRHTHRLMPESIARQFEDEVRPRIERLTELRTALEGVRTAAWLRLGRNTSKLVTRQVGELVDRMIAIGISKRQAFRNTTALLRAWYGDRLADLTEERVRLRYQDSQARR